MALGLLLSAGHPQRIRDAWVDTCVLTNQAHKWHLDSSSVLSKPLCPRGAWGLGTPTHTWLLGCAGSESCLCPT